MKVVHFIGFRGEEYWSAVKVWGLPHVVHMGWDKRAKRELGEDDLVIFARGTEHDEPRERNYPDIYEKDVTL